MKPRSKNLIIIALALLALVLGIGAGSVRLPPGDILGIIAHKLFGRALFEGIPQNSVAILWSLRLPRALLAFIVGAALSVSGVIMQSVLKNPLASSSTLGVSSGASLGAGLVLLLGVTIPALQYFTLPVLGFAFGLGTIVLAIAAASRIDGQMQNNTIILIGTVFALFINAVTTLMMSISREHMQRLIYWQMGSFATRGWPPVAILAPIALVGTLFVLRYSRELDIMTFGEDQARAMGVDLKRTKWTLLITSAALTGTAISFVGVIGFIDLVAPHVARRIFGSNHRLVIPAAAIMGGMFMTLCDLLARTIVSPQELPVGVVTSLIGGPFFAWIYFKKSKR